MAAEVSQRVYYQILHALDVHCELDLRCCNEGNAHKPFPCSSPSQAPLNDYLIRIDSPLL